MIGCPTIPRPTLPLKEASTRKLNFSQREIERETSIASLLTISSSLSSLFRVLCIFPLRYLCAIGLPPVFSFRWNLPPSFGLQSQTTRLTERRRPCGPQHSSTLRRPGPRTGFSPSMMPYPKGLGPRASVSDALSRGHNSKGPPRSKTRPPDFRLELFPFHSQLLRESLLVPFPPLSAPCGPPSGNARFLSLPSAQTYF